MGYTTGRELHPALKIVIQLRTIIISDIISVNKKFFSRLSKYNNLQAGKHRLFLNILLFGKLPTARWKREKEELQAVIEELKADNQPYQEELAFVKKVQSCADIARRDREMAEADTSGRSEEKMEEQKPEKKTSLLRKLDEKKKECAERDAKQQAVKKKRNYEMSL